MDYSTAIAAVNAGKYAWRTSWSGEWLHLFNGTIYLANAQGPGNPYSPTPADEGAHDWAEGDRPPH